MREDLFDKFFGLFFLLVGSGIIVISIGFILNQLPFFDDISVWVRYGGGIMGIGFGGVTSLFAIDIIKVKK